MKEAISQTRRKESSKPRATMKQRIDAIPQQRPSLGFAVIVCRDRRERGAASIRAMSIQKIQSRCDSLSALSMRLNAQDSAARDEAETPKTVAMRYPRGGNPK